MHVEFYITAWDDVTAPFFEALVRAAERGVTVRLLFDHLGSKGIPGYKECSTRLDATGIEWHPMLPIQPLKGEWRRPDLRNHRKILVVDGVVAFTGSQNLIEPGYNKPKNHKAGREWVELMARVEGPVVSALNVAVRHRLVQRDRGRELAPTSTGDGGRRPPARSTCQVIPSGPGFATENNLRAFTTLLYSAQTPAVDHQPLLRAGRVAAVRRHHGRPARGRGRALRQRGGRPVHGLPRPALLLRGAAAGRRADLPLPRAVRPALQALQRRRRRRGARLQQHGHALLRASTTRSR